MKAEILSIGTEITSGQNLDTNSQWLSRRLSELGVPTGFHVTIADDFADNVDCFRLAVARAGIVLVTGGLGPTLDDLTREVLAKVSGCPLREDPASLAHIQEMFQLRNRPMPERNRVQALVPEGAEVLPNPIGTAPGIALQIGSTFVAAMPGVPREMKMMFEEQVVPRLQAGGYLNQGEVVVERRINTFGAGESQVEELLGDVTRRGADPEVGITASEAVVSLRILTRAASRAEAESKIAPVEQIIRQKLDNLIFGVNDVTLEEAIVTLLLNRRFSVATAESITAGLIAHRIARVPGASATLRGGVIAYTNAVKTQELGVSRELLECHSAVSSEVAKAMASGVRTKFDTDFGLAATGYAGPTAGDDGTPVGRAFVALATRTAVISLQLDWFGSRQEIQQRTSSSALNLLRLHLLSPSHG